MKLLKTHMTWVSSLIFALLMAAVSGFRIHPLVPPLNDILSPVHGLWQNLQEPPFPVELKFSELQDSVFVFRDANDIYHLNSDSAEDLAFVQGYLQARERLWQMEFQARAGFGELSEVIGETTYNIDELMVRTGMRQAARTGLEAIAKDPETMGILEAYSKGVNNYIRSLEKKSYPPEYKFFSATPREWQPIHSIAIIKLMAMQLSGRSTDLQMSRILKRIGAKRMYELFPTYPERHHPIVKKQKWKKPSLPIPQAPDQLFESSIDVLNSWDVDPDSGSNNWAIGPSKTQSGHSIIANDTHLSYSMPNLWQMVQLTGPDWNVFGASITGAPGVVIGTTETVAWAFTNSPFDVLDWYEIQLTEDGKSYLYDGAELKLKTIQEEIQVRGKTTRTEAVLWTHHGPIVFPSGQDSAFHQRYPKASAMRWTAHSSSSEFRAIMQLNRARNIDDCEAAIRNFSSPAQNIICADSQNISITARGRMPVKWPRQGMTISDGSSKVYEWQHSIPDDELPHERNPKRGYVSSANNHTTTSSYPYYLNFRYDSSYRNGRIEDLLSKRGQWTLEETVQMQSDTYSPMAAELSPVFFRYADQWQGLTDFERWALETIRLWDFKDQTNSVATTLFLVWLNHTQQAAWHGLGSGVIWPSEDVFRKLLDQSPDQLFWSEQDRQAGTAKVLRKTLESTREKLTEKLGENYRSWFWSRYKNSSIPHVSRIPGWGADHMAIGGSNETILSHKGHHGPNWKIAVELLPEQPKVFAIYPGGASGNPLSLRYNTYLDDFRRGKLLEISFLKREDWISLPVSRMEPTK